MVDYVPFVDYRKSRFYLNKLKRNKLVKYVTAEFIHIELIDVCIQSLDIELST